MNSLKKISVIVVVYQSEKVLHRCIDSIINQTFGAFELILIDDGSSDLSGSICDEYSNKDDRILVYHRNHEGVSSSRQFGIEKANGEYTIFCDSDDWMDDNMLEILYHNAKLANADLVMCDAMMEFKDYSVLRKQHFYDLSPEFILKNLGYPVLPTVWNKLIRLDCYKRYNLFFPKEMGYAEDLYLLINLFSHPIKVAYGEAIYHYDRHSKRDSITKEIANIPTWISSLNYLETHINENHRMILINQKIGVLQMLMNYSIDELHKYDYLYRDINGYLLRNGILHPIRNRHLLEIALHRTHLDRLAVLFSVIISWGSTVKHILSK